MAHLPIQQPQQTAAGVPPPAASATTGGAAQGAGRVGETLDDIHHNQGRAVSQPLGLVFQRSKNTHGVPVAVIV